jgi:two-component system chemotaxis sensor kinase CheA
MNDFQVSPELVAIYLEDARAHLDALDACLLALEREGLVGEHVASVLGPLHTLKGNSGMMGFQAVKDYVHRLEDVFARISEGSIALEGVLFDRLFAGASSLRDAVEQACRQGGEVRDLGKEKALLESLLAAADAAPVAALPVAAPVTKAAAPAADAAEIEDRADAAARYVGARSNMVRVDFGQLDHLLNLVGELVIYRNKLHEVGHRFADALGGKSDAGRELLEAVQQVAGVSAQLQETVMDIRMLPIRHVFERFPRLVRDLARGQGKDIELILEGEGTRVDKAIIDEIGEPLVHMIRNAVDHGIEPPAVREAAGKTPTATILLSAAQESNHVVLTIMDDGAGIDPVRVRQKAIEKGLLRGDEPVGEREALQLIFNPGFSTRDAVSELSGRGVGLDVVLKSIERLNGLVDVESVPGIGTKFVIQLPLTLAIISALLVETAGRTYAIPLGAVVESLKFDRADVHRVGGRETLRIRERVVPLLRLSRLFDLPETERSGRHEYAVVLGRGDKRIGLVVDRLRGQQEVVIKALDASVTSQSFGIAGATIMGDGRVVLILDVAALFEGRRHGSAVREVLAEA